MGERVDARFLGCVGGNAACHIPLAFQLPSCDTVLRTETCQGVDSVNVHGTTSANTLATTPPESQSGVHLVLDPDERIQHHGSGLVQVECVRLHLGLGGRLIWVPSVDVEGLGLRIFAGLWILNCRCLALWDRRSRSIGYNLFGGLGDGLAGVNVVYGGKAAGENCRPYGCRGALAVLNCRGEAGRYTYQFSG